MCYCVRQDAPRAAAVAAVAAMDVLASCPESPSTESETRYEPAGERWSPRDRIIRKDYSKLGRDDFQRATASTARFYCKFPRCGKAYSSTDAVRKHCRQRHLEWLRRLGHGCPALYCEWDEE